MAPYILRTVVAVVFVTVFLGNPAEAITQGCLKLDALTVDKFLAIPGYRFLLKIDEPSTFGEKKKAFDAICKMSHAVPNFFAAEVPVQRFNNNKENDEVRVRFNLTREEFPAYYLYTSEGMKDGLRYSGPLQAPNIFGWLRDNGVMMPSIDTIDELDVLALEFLKSPDAEYIKRAKVVADRYTTDPKAQMYVKIMEKILVKGEVYAKDEVARLSTVLKGEVSREQVTTFHEKLKVLKVFAKIKACDVFQCPSGHKKKFEAEGIIGTDAETCCNPPCEDTYGETHDQQGHHCDYYETERTAKECGIWDDDDFRANSMCCVCGGGRTL